MCLEHFAISLNQLVKSAVEHQFASMVNLSHIAMSAEARRFVSTANKKTVVKSAEAHDFVFITQKKHFVGVAEAHKFLFIINRKDVVENAQGRRIVYTITKKVCVRYGHTANFTKRKSLHKSVCNNENSNGYNFKVYGNQENWTMIEIQKQICFDKRDTDRIEQ